MYQLGMLDTLELKDTLTLLRMGGGPTSFSPVTSTNVGFGTQTF